MKRMFFDVIGGANVLNQLSAERLLTKKRELCKEYKKHLITENCRKRLESSSLLIYPSLVLVDGLKMHLKMKLPLKLYQILSQLRLLNKINYK